MKKLDPKDYLNKIMEGDCLEIMRQLPSRCVDIVVTSPPYNLKNSSGNGMKDGRGGKWKNAGLIAGYENHGDAMPHKDYVKWQRACIKEMLRLVPEKGAVFYNHKWRVQNGLLQDRADIMRGFPVRQIIIWKRKGGFNFNRGYFLPTYEVIYMLAKKDFCLARGGNSIGDVWEIQQERNNAHPAPFPVELARRIVEATHAETILDPFMGSGSTAIAAKLEKRNYVGIEKSRKYCQQAESRIKSLELRT